MWLRCVPRTEFSCDRNKHNQPLENSMRRTHHSSFRRCVEMLGAYQSVEPIEGAPQWFRTQSIWHRLVKHRSTKCEVNQWSPVPNSYTIIKLTQYSYSKLFFLYLFFVSPTAWRYTKLGSSEYYTWGKSTVVVIFKVYNKDKNIFQTICLSRYSPENS